MRDAEFESYTPSKDVDGQLGMAWGVHHQQPIGHYQIVVAARCGLDRLYFSKCICSFVDAVLSGARKMRVEGEAMFELSPDCCPKWAAESMRSLAAMMKLGSGPL